MLSASRLQLIARSMTVQELAPWSRFYYLNMTTRALGLVVPRSLSTLGGKSVALGTLGLSLRRAIWIVILDNAFDVLLLSAMVGPGLLYLSKGGSLGRFAVLAGGLVMALAGGLWWLTSTERFQSLWKRFWHIPWLAHRVQIDLENTASLLLPRWSMIRALGLTVLLNGALAICFYFVAQAVGVSHPWPIFVAAFPATQLSLVLAVTPGGLGLFDAGWYGVLLLGGVPSEQALTFVIAQRAYIFVFVLIWAGFSVLLSLVAEGRRHA